MIVQTEVRFRARREPFPYDMSANGGPVGTSYSFEALDLDDTKVKIKCTEAQWNALASAQRDQKLAVRLTVGDPKVDGADGITPPVPAPPKS